MTNIPGLIDDSLRQKLGNELVAGEILLWAGRPGQGLKFRTRDIFYIPFSLVWFAVVFGIFMANYRQDKNSFFTWYGFLFLIVGVYIAVGRFLVESIIRRYTVYGVTSSRVIIGFTPSKSFKSLYFNNIGPEITIAEKKNGSGDIIFGPNNFEIGDIPGLYRLKRTQPAPRLVFLGNVRTVYDLIVRLRSEQDGHLPII
jgi:hypothetical protein